MHMLGFKIDARPAEDLVGLSRSVERSGFDQLWVCEDLGLAGGIAQVAAALTATTTLRVGLGITPAAVRNPMYLAMEFASVARLSGGRFHAGIGHGEPRWLTQVGQHPGSLMTCLHEVTAGVRDLLTGQVVTFSGDQVHLDRASLTHPPVDAVPISLGVRGPKGIELAKQLGTGVILAEGSTPEYVAAVRRTLGPDAPITVFTWAHLDADDAAAGFEALRPTIEEALHKRSLTAQLGDLYGATCQPEVIRRLSVSGDVQTCLDAVALLVEGGADNVVLQPIRGREEEQIERFGQHLTAQVP
jgi:5,10-methylenetetrahydromethanopterin reductase